MVVDVNLYRPPVLSCSQLSQQRLYLSFEELGFPGCFWCSERLSITKGCKSIPLSPCYFSALKILLLRSNRDAFIGMWIWNPVLLYFFFLNERPFSFFQKTFPSHVFMNSKLLLISPELFSTLHFFLYFFPTISIPGMQLSFCDFLDSLVQLLSSHRWSCLFVPMWCSPVTSVYALSIKPVGSNGGLKCSRQNAGQMQSFKYMAHSPGWTRGEAAPRRRELNRGSRWGDGDNKQREDSQAATPALGVEDTLSANEMYSK